MRNARASQADMNVDAIGATQVGERLCGRRPNARGSAGMIRLGLLAALLALAACGVPGVPLV